LSGKKRFRHEEGWLFLVKKERERKKKIIMMEAVK
jgi:hypothetical protein